MAFDLYHGDAYDVLRSFEDGQVRCCVTSPPYFALRDYGHPDQIGNEAKPEEYIHSLVSVLREVRRVLADDGTLWLNLGDSRKDKNLLLIPARVALALQVDGWVLRSEIVWQKLNPLPESVPDRFSSSHEFVFFFGKTRQYYFDVDAVKEPIAAASKKDKRRTTERSRDYAAAAAAFGDGTSAARRTAGNAFFSGQPNSWKGSSFNKGKTAISQVAAQSEDSRKNSSSSSDARVVGFQDRWDGSERSEMRRRRDVWSIASQPFKGAHFAPMPEKLVEPCILAGSAPGDVVLDPFCGSGTVGVVALRHGRNFVGVDLNSEYLQIAHDRITSSLGVSK